MQDSNLVYTGCQYPGCKGVVGGAVAGPSVKEALAASQPFAPHAERNFESGILCYSRMCG